MALTFIVLDKFDRTYLLIEFLLRPGFKEIASFISKDLWLNYDDSWNICLNYIHLLKLINVLCTIFLELICNAHQVLAVLILDHRLGNLSHSSRSNPPLS